MEEDEETNMNLGELLNSKSGAKEIHDKCVVLSNYLFGDVQDTLNKYNQMGYRLVTSLMVDMPYGGKFMYLFFQQIR